MKRIRFYKELDGRWYADIPQWTGGKDALEMVCGADSMLFCMAEGADEITLNISESHFDNSDEIRYVKAADDLGSGAYYQMDRYRGIEIDMDMWLCPVLEWLFGYYPKKLFVAPIN